MGTLLLPLNLSLICFLWLEKINKEFVSFFFKNSLHHVYNWITDLYLNGNRDSVLCHIPSSTISSEHIKEFTYDTNQEHSKYV